MRLFFNCIRIMRPLNGAIAFAGIFAAGLIAGGAAPPFGALAVASLAGMLVGSAGNIVNDLFDVAVDRINKPHRVLPSGGLSRAAAWIWACACAAGGVALAFSLSPALGITAAACALLLFIYDASLKNRPAVGNLVVSLVTGTAFPFGAACAGDASAGLIPGLFAAVYTFGREVVKDMEDVEGDRSAGAATLPLAFGLPAARRIATGVFLLIVAASPLPWIAGKYNLLYLALVVAGVDLLLGYVIFRLWKDDSRDSLRRSSAALKLGMPLGIAAVYLGTLSLY